MTGSHGNRSAGERCSSGGNALVPGATRSAPAVTRHAGPAR